MAQSATLTKSGQVTVPKWVREILGVNLGERIVFRKVKDSINIEREKTAAEIANHIHSLIPEETRQAYIREYGGLTASEVREKWAKSEDGKKFFEEEIKRCL